MRGHHGDSLLDEADDFRLRRRSQRNALQVKHGRDPVFIIGVDDRPQVLHLSNREIIVTKHIV